MPRVCLFWMKEELRFQGVERTSSSMNLAMICLSMFASSEQNLLVA